MKSLCDNVKSILIALFFSFFMLALWYCLTVGFNVTVIFLVGLALLGIIAIISEWRIGSFGATDLSDFPFQTSPIAAASFLAGWSSFTMIKDSNTENSILLFFTAGFCLISIFAYVESAFPDKRGKIGNYSRREKLLVSVNVILIHGLLCAAMGYGAALRFNYLFR